jgi:small subunit ribosomal protein S13
MVMFFNRELSGNKTLVYGLVMVYGIGINLAKVFCKKIGLNYNIKVSAVTEEKLLLLYRLLVRNYLLDYELEQRQNEIKRRRIGMRCYKGLRYLYGLPANGQRTKTNSRTVKALREKK